MLYVSTGAKETYSTADQREDLTNIVEIKVAVPPVCDMPIIGHEDMRLLFGRSTPNVRFHYTITARALHSTTSRA